MTQAFTALPPEGLKFLRSLKRNNNREWFLAHKETYETFVKKPMQDLIQTLASDFEEFAPEILASPKTSLYRIYRDTRFSKDKSPYKTHVAASFPRKGLDRHQGAGLYLHIAPTEVLLGGGVYMPLPEDLKAVRLHIANRFAEFRNIIQQKSFRQVFGDVVGEQLSRAPRGFDPEHPAADYVRYKQYLASRTLEPESATSNGFYKNVVGTFRAMMPFIRFLNEPLVDLQKVRERKSALMAGG